MTTKTNERQMLAWRTFLQTYAKVIRALEDEMQEEQGLSLTWYDILAHLDDAPHGALRMQDLADSVLLSRSGLTRLIDRMEKAALVCRQPCEEDRRGMYAVITDEGRATLRRAMPGHIRGIQEHFLRHLEVSDTNSLHQVLEKVLTN